MTETEAQETREPERNTVGRSDGREKLRPRAFYLSSPCPLWCMWEHAASDHPHDRHHSSYEEMPELTLEPAVKMHDGTWTPEHLRVYLWQHVEAAEPAVMLCKGDDRGFRLTLAEARELTQALTDLIGHAELG